MTKIVPINTARPPQRLQQRMQSGVTTTKNFADNVVDSFPRLSIRGRAFRVRFNGEERNVGQVIDPNQGPVVDVVLVNASDMLSKAYYENPYQTGDMEQPDCWSLDSVRPDPSVARKQNPTCLDCPKNFFGSASSGRGGKACQDSRRVVITTQADLQNDNPSLTILRVPQQSLKNMKLYAEHIAKYGYEPGACITRLSFDLDAEFPKLQFQFAGPLDDKSFDVILDLTEGVQSKRVADMLRRPDFENAASNPQLIQQRRAPQAPQATQPIQQRGFGAVVQETVEVQAEGSPGVADDGTWEDLGDGTELNLATGEVRDVQKDEAPERMVDPDVITTSDGRFFNRKTKKFVNDQYVAEAAPSNTPAAPQAAPPKRTRAKKAAGQPAQAGPAPAASPEADNGGLDPADKPKPIVVPASPKLDALLGGLVPPKG